MKLRLAAAVFLVASCLPAAAQDGASLYDRQCARCHDASDPQSRVPSRGALQAMSFTHVMRALTTGSMASFVQAQTEDERRAIAAFVTGGLASAPVAATDANGRCAQRSAFPQPLDGPRWNGWGAGPANRRFQTADMARLAPDEVPRLKLKWAFGFAMASSAFAQPAVIGGLLFVGGTDHKVHALDAKSGCTLWEFSPEADVRAAISFAGLPGTDRPAVFFGDLRANVYALDALTGELIWKTRVDDHPAARVTGALTAFEGALYVPVASLEELTGSSPTYQCCTFRGSVVALDATTGKQIWKSYTIPEAPHPTIRNAVGTQLYGPSGASVWSAPTIDASRRALYVATSNAYSDPAAETSDAILAFDLATGRMLWHRQATPGDAFVVACFTADPTNCPRNHGPDEDFGQSPILVTLHDGRRLVVVAQKSGVVHALDPDQDGKFVWQTQVGKGGSLGGSEWGSAADQDRIYVAISDVRFMTDGTRRLNPAAGGGLFALNLADGKVALQVPPVPCGDRPLCSPALSAAVTAVPGVVFSGGVSGYLRAYATSDAHLLWEVDTVRDFTTVNRVAAHGGAIDGPGPVVVDGMLYVNSGYVTWSGEPGNVLLAFEVGDR